MRRECQFCASLPDGVFPLLKRNSDGTYNFLSLCVLEMKTRGSEKTIDELSMEVEDNGDWIECEAGKPLFKTAIPDASYRSQVGQHAAALNLEYVMMVYSVPGALPKRIVLVRISEVQRNALVHLQKVLGNTYLSFMLWENADLPFELPNLGDDFCPAYDYAQEHHTAETWLWMAREARLNGDEMS